MSDALVASRVQNTRLVMVTREPISIDRLHCGWSYDQCSASRAMRGHELMLFRRVLAALDMLICDRFKPPRRYSSPVQAGMAGDATNWCLDDKFAVCCGKRINAIVKAEMSASNRFYSWNEFNLILFRGGIWTNPAFDNTILRLCNFVIAKLQWWGVLLSSKYYRWLCRLISHETG